MEKGKIKRTIEILGSIFVIAMMVEGVNAGSAIIHGYTFDETGAPLGEVNVTWENVTTHQVYGWCLSDSNGEYFLTDTFDGIRESVITATKLGYSPNSTTRSIKAGEWIPEEYKINFTLTKDVTPPNITNLQPPDGAIINDNTPTISADYSDASGINTDTVTMSVDGIDVTSDATITESGISYEPSPLSDGQHNVSIYVEDNAGNSATVDWAFVVDTVEPIVNIVSPVNTTYKVDTVELNCTATDPNNISVVWYSLNGGANVTISATDEQWYNATLTDLTSGPYCITVYANDTAGNIGSDSVCFTIEARVWVNVSLCSGWNMIGVPLNMSDWTLPTVLDSIDGHYQYVYYFNATTDTMQYYVYGHPEWSTLFELEPGAGYLIKMTTADMLNWYGLKFEAPSRYLESGWNMFSVPYGIANKTLPTVLDSIDGHYQYVYYFNATTDTMQYYVYGHPEWSTLFELEPGAGYLIKMTTADTFVPEME